MNYKIQSVLSLLQMAQKQGVEADRLCVLSGISLDSLKAGQVPDMATLDRIWLNAIKLTGDSYLGLHIGEEGGLAALGIVGQIIQSSATVGEALNHTCEFVNLISDAFQLKLDKGNSDFSIVFEIDKGCWQNFKETVKQNIDTALVFSMKEYNILTLGQAKPTAIRLPWPKPGDDQEYERVFGSPILYQQPRASISFSPQLLDERIITADYELSSFLVTHAQRLQEGYSAEGRFSERVRQTIVNQSYINVPRIRDVAAVLNVSVRTLQRKLKEERVTFQELQDDTRQRLAKQYLKQKVYPIKEVSYILGYNEVSAFNRSFKRWTGITPSKYREARA